jgi:hypothetical protein
LRRIEPEAVARAAFELLDERARGMPPAISRVDIRSGGN